MLRLHGSTQTVFEKFLCRSVAIHGMAMASVCRLLGEIAVVAGLLSGLLGFAIDGRPDEFVLDPPIPSG